MNGVPKRAGERTMLTLMRSSAVWAFFVVLGVLNGAVREKLLVPFLGRQAAMPLSGALLSALIFLAALAVFRFLGVATASQAWHVGILWLALTMAFEFLFGHFVMGDPWRDLLAAYEVWNGNLWVMVLAATLCSPYLAGKVRGSL